MALAASGAARGLAPHFDVASAVFIVGLVLFGRCLGARTPKQIGVAIQALMAAAPEDGAGDS